MKFQEYLAEILDELSRLLHISTKQFLEQKALPHKALENLTRFFNLIDQSSRLYLSQVKSEQGLEVYCHPGCSWCCFQMPEGIHVIEYIYLYHGISKMHPRNLYLARILDRCEFFMDILGCSADEKPSENALDAYFKKKQPCPFLNKRSQSCEVYSYRPIICRTHFSFSPPRFCHPEQKEPWRRHIVNIEPSPMVKDKLIKLDRIFPFRLSQFLIPGMAEFIVNIMECKPIIWV